ncbi:MAG: hypothetical protein KAJ48_02975 [Elusimicrobiales bacterium]|nr:hypothetical protein [Elusimicrobiales bacterium]
MSKCFLWSRKHGHTKIESFEMESGEVYFNRSVAKKSIVKIKGIIKKIFGKQKLKEEGE